MIKKCELCGSKKRAKEGKLRKCQKCGFIQADDEYFDIDPYEIYNSKYYTGLDYADYKFEKLALQTNFLDRLNKIKKFITSGSLLEIGSAYGFFLELAKSNFDVEGVEVSKQSSAFSRKIVQGKIYNSIFENITFKHKYDCVVSLDTIEHVRSPKEFLKAIHKILNKGGYLFLETGDIGSLLARAQKDSWRLIYPPQHLNYFSTDTITAFLEKEGFDVLRIDRVPFARTVNQILYRSNIRFARKIPKFVLSIPVTINTFDLMFVSARKKVKVK